MQNKTSIQLLLFANAVSQFAQGISMIAIPWYFINNLKEGNTYNVLFFVVTALTLFWAQYAGTIIDKYNRKNIFQGLCLFGFIVLLGAGLYGEYYGEVPMGILYVVFGFTVLNYNIHYPALYALAQEYSDKESYVRVNSLLEVQGQSTSMLSGAAAAVLIGGISSRFLGLDISIDAWPIQRIFLMDASTYCLAFVLLSFLKTQHLEKLDRDIGSVWKRLKRGWKYLGDNRAVLYFGLFTYIIFVTVLVHMFYLVHLYVSDYLQQGGASLAAAEIFHAIGALCAGVFLKRALGRWSTVNVSLYLMLICTLCFAGIAYSKNIWFFAPLCMVIGFANSGIRITRVSALFKLVPKETLGRVTSVFQSANIFMRLVVIALFHLPFFITNPEKAYLVYVAINAICILPLLFNYTRIVEAIDDNKSAGVLPGTSRIK